VPRGPLVKVVISRSSVVVPVETGVANPVLVPPTPATEAGADTLPPVDTAPDPPFKVNIGPVVAPDRVVAPPVVPCVLVGGSPTPLPPVPPAPISKLNISPPVTVKTISDINAPDAPPPPPSSKPA